MTRERNITWALSDGRKANVSVTLTTTRTANADGHEMTVACCDLDVIATVDGLGTVGRGGPVSAETADAKIGKLGMSQDIANQVNAAIADMEATQEWAEKMKSEAQWNVDEADYQLHTDAMSKAMSM